MANPLDSPFETDTDPFAIDEVAPVEAVAESTTTQDPYYKWLNSTEIGQRSPTTGYTPDLLASLGMTADELAAGAAKRDRDNAAAMASLTPEMLARLEGMDLSGLGNGMMGGKPLDVGTFARENQYKNITQYNPVGTAPEDMVVYDDLGSSKAKAAKASREKEVAALLQGWTAPLKELATNNPEQFQQEYSQLPTDARLSYLRNEYDQGNLGKREYQDAFAEQWNNSEKKETGVLQFIPKYGYRMNSPDAIAQQGGQDQQGARDWYEADKVFGGEKGKAGDHSYLGSFTPTVKESFDATSFGRGVLASGPFRAAIAIMSGGISEGVIAAGRGLTGDTLHASDWLSIATAGMQLLPEGMEGLTEIEAAAAADEAVFAAQEAAKVSNLPFTMADADAVYSGAYSQARGLEVLGMNLGDVKNLVLGEGGIPPSQEIKDAVKSVEDMAAGVDAGVITNLKDTVDAAVATGSDLNTVLNTINTIATEIQFSVDEETAEAKANADIVITNDNGDQVDITGVTPDMPSTVTDVEPVYDVEPIVADPIVVDISESGGGGGSGEGGDTGGDSGAAQPPTETSDLAAEENNWEYLGDGVFKHIETGETLQETITGEDPYIVGDTYSGPSSGSAEDTTDPSEVIDIISDILEDTTAESPVSSDPIITYDPTTVTDPATGTADTGTATGDGTGTGTGTGDTVGTGDTTGTGAGGGDATGTGSGTGDGTGTGSGSGTGDGTGSGDGSGDGEGEGIGTGSSTPIAATSTTDSLFGDLLGIDQTITAQKRLMPFKASEARRLQETEAAQANLLQRFIQPTRPQGMLTRRF